MRVAVHSGYGLWGAMTADQPEKMHVGGGESTLIALVNRLADAGHDVTVFANVEKEGEQHGATWLKRDRTKDIESTPWDTFLSFENFSVNAKKAKLRLFAMQCNHFPGIGQHLEHWDRFVFVSHWHQWAVREWLRGSLEDADFPPEKSVVIPNAVDETRYEAHVNREPFRLHYSSSPDRGLVHLLRFFPEIRAAYPDTTLHVYYDIYPSFNGNKWAMNKNHEELWFVYRKMVDPGQPGVFYHGPVNQLKLAKEQMKAQMLVYPCDTNWPSEGFGISIGEAMAAGMAVVASDCDAIGEVWADGLASQLPLPIRDGQWVEVACGLLGDPIALKEYQQRARDYVRRYTWDNVYPQWEAALAC